MQRNDPMARQDTGLKSMIFDPMESATSMGYYHKATNLSHGMLRNMAKTPIIRAIINTRKDQVAEFCKVQEQSKSKGFVIKKKGVEEGEEVSDRDKKVIEKLTEFVLACGDVENTWKWDNFETMIRKFTEDSLVLDQGTFEVIPMRNFEPYAWVAVDGATFRIADSYDDVSNIADTVKVRGSYPSYVQIYQNRVVREFYPWELCFATRNPSTNIYSNNYGRAELEDLVATVTAMLNADSYNAKFFRHGSAPKGALLVKKGNINPDKVQELRRDWNAMMAGVNNSHKTPILDAESVEWLDFQKNNRDMEFSKFQEYLIKLACAVFKISPEELGFTLEGGKGGIGGNDSGKEEKKYSIDKGLKPILTFLETLINKYIIGPKTNGQYIFKFVGIDVESVKEESERDNKDVLTHITPDELRKKKNLPPLPNGAGKLPLSPVISQMQMMGQQQQQEQQQKDEEGEDMERENQNPFLEDDDNVFSKSFNDWFVKEYTDIVA